MLGLAILIGILVLMVTASLAVAFRLDKELRASVVLTKELQEQVKSCEEKVETIRTSLMKVLLPIRQNAEDIDAIDDDLARLQRLYDRLLEQLKKREMPPASD